MSDTQFAVQVTEPIAVPEAIPKELRGLFHLDDKHGVLICIPCKQAVEPGALAGHIKRSHPEAKGSLKVARGYSGRTPLVYTHSTIELPEDGSDEHVWLAVQEGWECTRCGSGVRPFHTINDRRLRDHKNKYHGLQGEGLKEVARKVWIQSWFLDGRERYWRVKRVVRRESPHPELEQLPQGIVNAGGEAAAERIEMAVQVSGIVIERPRRRRRRVTGLGVQAAAEAGSGGVEGGGGMMAPDNTTGEGVVTARGMKRRASIGSECSRRTRVRFAEYVEIEGLVAFRRQLVGLEQQFVGLKQQLDRWSRECVVCHFVAGGRVYRREPHQVGRCMQEAAKGVRRYSKKLDQGIKEAWEGGEIGLCRECGVPQVVCKGWQWGEGHGGWIRDPERRCQYGMVLIPAMVAMIHLGSAEGAVEVKGWLDRDNVEMESTEQVCRWFGERVGWEGIEVARVVVLLMMLARINGVERDI